MATITTRRIGLWDSNSLAKSGYTYGTATAGQTWERGDLLTVVTAGTVSKLAAGGATAVNLALGVNKYPDGYVEPIVAGGGTFGLNSPKGGFVEMQLLGDRTAVEINVSGVLALTNIGKAYDIVITSGIAKVNLASQANAAFYIERLTGTTSDGIIGDTDVRVVGWFLDSVCFGGN